MSTREPNGSTIPWPLSPVAHRGLHQSSAGILENTPSAVLAAIAKGYAIEVDLQAAADATAMVFHDETLDRLMQSSGDVIARTPADLQSLIYRACNDRIMTLTELLGLVAGRVPLFIEVKTLFGEPGVYEAGIAEQLLAYQGPVAVMSFDPVSLARLKLLAPSLPHGFISYRWDDGWMPHVSVAERLAMQQLRFQETIDLAFVAYDINALSGANPEPAPLAFRASGKPLLAWTVRTPEQRARCAAVCDAMIFEGFEP